MTDLVFAVFVYLLLGALMHVVMSDGTDDWNHPVIIVLVVFLWLPLNLFALISSIIWRDND